MVTEYWPMRSLPARPALCGKAARGGILGLLILAGSAAADPGIMLADARPGDSNALQTGEQLLIADRTGPLDFGGHHLSLDNFTGILGYANELAYVAVIDGKAATGKTKAKAGRMLILRPYGAKISAEHFDAIRLADQWSAATQTAEPDAYASLEGIRHAQQRQVWFGRLGQTNYNVAASGSARNERATRTLVGTEAVRDIRFSGASDPMDVERMVVVHFLIGLKSGDTKTVAALLDPTPFGGRALAGGGDEARVLAAKALIASRDWSSALGTVEAYLSDGAWRAGNATVSLRNIDDFVFVTQVSGGAN